MDDDDVLQKYVLVLNQNFEPMSICNVKRAIILIYLGKAEIVERDSKLIRAIQWSFPLPLVVRLMVYIRLPHKKIVLTRKNVIKRDNHLCQYCGERYAAMTVDHIIPKTRGGKDTWDNLVCACVACNNKKGNQTLEQAGFTLRRTPIRPTHLMFIKHFVGIRSEKWKPYLFMN